MCVCVTDVYNTNYIISYMCTACPLMGIHLPLAIFHMNHDYFCPCRTWPGQLHVDAAAPAEVPTRARSAVWRPRCAEPDPRPPQNNKGMGRWRRVTWRPT